MRRVGKKKTELRKRYFELLLRLPIGPKHFPDELVDIVAKYAIPVGDDVRIAWLDDGEHWKKLIECQSIIDVDGINV
jgi:hypothetical protein